MVSITLAEMPPRDAEGSTMGAKRAASVATMLEKAAELGNLEFLTVEDGTGARWQVYLDGSYRRA